MQKATEDVSHDNKKIRGQGIALLETPAAVDPFAG
jgi:hypothetical protein